jgi:hypothetical protein
LQTTNRIAIKRERDVMRIKIENHLKKLSQLDRIEFRQRMSIIHSKMKNPLFFLSKYYLIGGLALMLYSVLIAPSYGDALFLKFFEIGGDALKIGVALFFLECIVLICILLKSEKQRMVILKEYFPKLFGDEK